MSREAMPNPKSVPSRVRSAAEKHGVVSAVAGSAADTWSLASA